MWGREREKNKFIHVTKTLIPSHPKLLAIIFRNPHGVYCFPVFGEFADLGKILKYYEVRLNLLLFAFLPWPVAWAETMERV